MKIPSKEAPRRRFGCVMGLMALIASPLVIGSCGSMAKAELEGRLEALGKNAPVRSLQRLKFEADLGDGLRDFELVYHHASGTDAESSSAAPIVLVHGTPSTLFSWSELIHGTAGSSGSSGLAASHDVYAIEVIGHGIAPGEVSPVTFERCARFVSAAIRALGLERVHLVGSSYGGEFVWRAALNEPDLIESVVLIDSSGVRRREADWLPEELAMRDNPLAKLGWLINDRDRIEAALAPHFREIPPDRVEEFFLVCDNASNWKSMVDLARDENGEREAELPELTASVLLLWGADDVAYTPDYYAQRFLDLLPNARLVALPETGHYPHEERPAEVVATLNAFFQGLAAQPVSTR